MFGGQPSGGRTADGVWIQGLHCVAFTWEGVTCRRRIFYVTTLVQSSMAREPSHAFMDVQDGVLVMSFCMEDAIFVRSSARESGRLSHKRTLPYPFPLSLVANECFRRPCSPLMHLNALLRLTPNPRLFASGSAAPRMLAITQSQPTSSDVMMTIHHCVVSCACP